MKSRSFPSFFLILLTTLIAAAGEKPATAKSPAPPPPNKGDVYVVPFSHLDLFWAGTREETLSRGDRIIAKAIQVAKQYPEARYLLEDEVFVANFVETHRGTPELADFKRLVKEGRIEIGPKWAGIYQNLPRGEALVRNLYYGKQYARTVFGVDPQTVHLGDLPGYTWQFPQIVRRADVPNVIMTRMGPQDKSLFNWKSPDGTTALVWYAKKGYGWGVGLGLHKDLDEARFTKIKSDLDDVQKTVNGPIYLGWGTDLFAPSDKVVQNVPVLNKTLAPWTFRVATPDEYFRTASQVKDLPVVSGEIPSSWSNLLTSLFRLWAPVLKATDTLVNAEKFATINYALGYADYPQKEIDALWKQLLQSMDHNNFGQGGVIGDTRHLEFSRNATVEGGAILREMLRNIAERVKQPFPVSTAIVVFNPLNWTRNDVVDTHLSLYGDVGPGDRLDQYRKAMRLVDETGKALPFRLFQTAGTVSMGLDISFIARDVPPLGYKTYYMVPADQADSFPNAATVTLDDANPARPKRTFDADKLENEFYVVTIDRATGAVTVFDKELGRNIVRDASVVGTEERGGNSIAIEPYTGREQLFTPMAIDIEQNNATKCVARIRGTVAGVPVTERVFLYSGLKKVDIETSVDWPQNRFMRLQQRFAYEQQDAERRYGIPFGSAGDNDIMPGTGPHSRDEVTMAEWKTWRQIQDWVFIGNKQDGFTLSADRQLMIVGPGVVNAGMLRGTYSTQEFRRDGKIELIQVPDPGTYTFRYSLTSGKGDWAAAKSYRVGSNFANPLIPVTSVDELSAKPLPATHSFLKLDADNLVVSAIKKADQDRGIIVRLYEAEGKSVATSIDWLGSDRGFQAVNLLEEKLTPTEQKSLEVKPYAIETVRVSMK